MVIPGCHSGKLNRGSIGALSRCEEEDDDDCNFVDMRGCDDHTLF